MSASARFAGVARTGLVGLALAGVLAARAVGAHSLNETLGAGAAATDHLQVTCVGAQSLSVYVLDASPGALPLVGVHVRRNDALVSASDTIGADGTPSVAIALNEGSGAYTVLVTKTGSGEKYYTLTFHCTTGPDGTGSHATTSSSLLQDQ